MMNAIYECTSCGREVSNDVENMPELANIVPLYDATDECPARGDDEHCHLGLVSVENSGDEVPLYDILWARAEYSENG